LEKVNSQSFVFYHFFTYLASLFRFDNLKTQFYLSSCFRIELKKAQGMAASLLKTKGEGR
jgi:hypothetical protein